MNHEVPKLDMSNVSLHEEKVAKLQPVICQGWPAAAIVLQEIADAVKNPVTKIVIHAVIAIGNGLMSQLCGK